MNELVSQQSRQKQSHNLPDIDEAVESVLLFGLHLQEGDGVSRKL